MRYVEFKLDHVYGKARKPYRKYIGDAGWDLTCCENTVIKPHEVKDIHTGVYMNMPPYIFARITGRSSTLRKHNLLVNEAIIDNGYTGELFICVKNMSDQPFFVESGMRLAQIIFHRMEDVRWVEVEAEKFKDKDRGNKGFGSTGIFTED
jgi:dUTP pyrophosphatase